MKSTPWSLNVHHYPSTPVKLNVTLTAGKVFLTLRRPEKTGVSSRLRIEMTEREARELAETIAPRSPNLGKWE